ncbi:MAG: hypothetical protein AB7T59_16735 [Hyphomonadaceae bacterium]
MATLHHRSRLLSADDAAARTPSRTLSFDSAIGFACESLLLIAYVVLLLITPIAVAAMALVRWVRPRRKVREAA